MAKVPAEPTEVDAFFALLEHPHADALQVVRRIILQADASIAEGIKWKVPSFRTSEYFATMHLRTKQDIGLILHFGARKKDGLTAQRDIADPTGLLAWLAEDRAVIAFANAADVKAKRQALTNLIRQWIQHL